MLEDFIGLAGVVFMVWILGEIIGNLGSHPACAKFSLVGYLREW